MIKRILLFSIILVILSGCQDYTEYEDMALVFGIGLDYYKDSDSIYTTIDQTNKIAAPLGGESGGDSGYMHINIAYAKTFEESLNLLQQYINREIFLGYTRCLVIGKDLAKRNLDDIISYLQITPRIRTSAYIVVAENTAYEILSAHDPSEDTITTEVIDKLLNNTRGTGGIMPVTIGDLYKMLYFEGLEISLPIVRIEKTIDAKDKFNKGDKAKDNNEVELPLELPSTMGYVKQINAQHKIDKFAVFKNTKLVGVLNKEQSLHLSMIKNNKTRSHFTDTLTYKGKKIDYSLLLTNNSSKIVVDIKEKVPKVEVQIKLVGTIEKFTNLEDLFEIKAIEDIQRIISNQIKSKIEKTITSVQSDYNSDVFGFGYQFFLDRNKEWNSFLKDDWDKLFKELNVKVNVSTKIINTGKQLRFKF